MRKDALFIAVEVDEEAAADTELARRLTEACPVDIFAQKPDGSLEIVEQNLDECVLCRLCLDAVESDPTHPDQDLALLEGGDRYARGLAKLAALGDLEATAGLADIISLVAQANAAGDLQLVDAVWRAGAVAIGWGTSEALEAAKRRARAGARDAVPALLAAAAARRADAGRGSGARSEL